MELIFLVNCLRQEVEEPPDETVTASPDRKVISTTNNKAVRGKSKKQGCLVAFIYQEL